ncbi:MAG TPA: ATP-binding protein [Fibrobacteria bacterium]|nr:ATP-binding protein [Fibrobacteria bacterium]
MLKITSINARLILFISAILTGTVLAILFSMDLILVRFQKHAIEQDLRRTELLANALITSKLAELKVQSQLVGELPILSTVVENGELNTIKDAGRTYRDALDVPIFDIMGRDGKLIAGIGDEASPEDSMVRTFAQRILVEGSLSTLLPRGGKLTLMAGAPIGTSEDASGVLLLGWNLDSAFAGRIRDFTKSEILFLGEGRVRGSSLPKREYAELEPIFSKLHGLHMEGKRAWFLKSGAYAVKSAGLKDMDGKEVGETLILTALSEQRKILSTLKYSLVGVALLVFMAALALAFRFSTGFTKPIAEAIRFAQKLASGDRGVPIRVDRTDELGALQDSLEKMRIALNGLIENLDAKVKEAIKHVTNILDNLDSGFLILDSRGIIQPGYSRISEEYFGSGLAGRSVEEILALDAAERQSAEDWRDVTFQGILPFKDAAKLGPGSFDKLPGRHIGLSYRPIYADGKLEGVILIAADKTVERRLARKFEMEKEKIGLIMRITANPMAFTEFIGDSRAMIDELERRIGGEAFRTREIETVLRTLHTLKGNAAMYGCTGLKDAAHDLEDELSVLQPGGGTGGFPDALGRGLAELRERLDKVVKDHAFLIGDPTGKSGDLRRITLSGAVLSELEKALLGRLGKESGVYAMFADCLLLEPFAASLWKYEGLVADLAERRQKRIKPILWQGDSVKVRMSVYKGLAGSLAHAFRNAVDHGIESPETRESDGKDPEGRLWVTVEKTGGEAPRLSIRIKDDGKGIDPGAIRRKIAETRLLEESEADRLDDFSALQFVFHIGFTLSESVTETSGRGVGMNAIAFEAEQLGGKAWIDSSLGTGTELFIEVPIAT